MEDEAAEELYDLAGDPDEVTNLADKPDHAQTLARLRKAQQDHVLEIRDVGFLPEGEMHARAAGSTPYDMGHDDTKYPLERILAAAELAAGTNAEDTSLLVERLHDDDSAVRYWAATGLVIRGPEGAAATQAALMNALEDDSPYVHIAAAEGLAAMAMLRINPKPSTC